VLAWVWCGAVAAGCFDACWWWHIDLAHLQVCLGTPELQLFLLFIVGMVSTFMQWFCAVTIWTAVPLMLRFCDRVLLVVSGVEGVRC
jgi:hypothetical protein